MNKSFIISKYDMFVIFQASKIKNCLYLIITICTFFAYYKDYGFTFAMFILIIKGILLVMLMIEPLFFIFRRKFENVPYKMVLDPQNKTIEFFMCLNHRKKKYKFSNIESIINELSYLKFKINTGEKLSWSKNSKNINEILNFIEKNGLNGHGD